MPFPILPLVLAGSSLAGSFFGMKEDRHRLQGLIDALNQSGGQFERLRTELGPRLFREAGVLGTQGGQLLTGQGRFDPNLAESLRQQAFGRAAEGLGIGLSNIAAREGQFNLQKIALQGELGAAMPNIFDLIGGLGSASGGIAELIGALSGGA